MISILVSLHDLSFSGRTPHHNLSFVMEPFLIFSQKMSISNFVVRMFKDIDFKNKRKQ